MESPAPTYGDDSAPSPVAHHSCAGTEEEAAKLDIVARLLGQSLSERLRQPVVIENRPGAGTNIGTEAVVNAPPDGYTLLVAGTPAAINATLYEKLNFNFGRDISPVAGIIRTPYVMETNPVPTKTVPEFIEYAKANPGKINMASAGNGTGAHLSGELFKLMTGTNMVHVPYRGAAPALVDLPGRLVPGIRFFWCFKIPVFRANRDAVVKMPAADPRFADRAGCRGYWFTRQR